MKSLITVIVLSFILATNVSADRNRKHEGGGHNNHQIGSSKHISKHSRHYYYNRHNNHGRRYISYARPYRHDYYPRYYRNYDVVIVSPSLFVGF
jgi:Ni/Co efflux regulator RcnB